MTISTTTRRAGPFIGDGVVTLFPFAFKVFSATDLLVVQLAGGVESPKALTADYTVTLNANQNATPGGTLLMLVAPPVGATLVFTSAVLNLQSTDLTNAGGFYPKVINDALDRATIQIQQLAEKTGRTLQLPLSSTASPVLPPPAASLLLAWNAAATALENVNASKFAGLVAFGFNTVQTFVSNGITTVFVLAASPTTSANTQVYVNGVYQEKSTYILTGSTLTFSGPLAVGNIEVVFANVLPMGATTADLVVYTAAGVAAAARTSQSKLREIISVGDYKLTSDPDDSNSFQRAVNALSATGGRILVPDAAYVLSTVPTIGIKSIYWDIGAAATFSGAGTGQGLFPYMMTNTAQLAVGPYIRSQSRQKSTNSNGGVAAFNVEMLIPDDNGPGQSVGIYAGLRTNNANPLANGWAANFLVSVQSAALGTHQVIEIDVDCNSAAALVKGISISGGGNANPDVALEITRASMRWDRGVDIYNAQDALLIHPVSGGRAIVIGSPVAQGDTSISAKQAALNADIMLFQRFADTGPGGNLMRLVNAANSSNLFIVDTSGNLSCGLINAIGAITTTDVVNGNFIIGNNLRASVGAVPAPVGTLAIGSSLASTATAGGNGALPAQVAQYIIVYQGATQLKIPAYNQ